jgi:hypothetical protein
MKNCIDETTHVFVVYAIDESYNKGLAISNNGQSVCFCTTINSYLLSPMQTGLQNLMSVFSALNLT